MPEVYTLIADGDTDPESIIDAPLMTALNKNLTAALEGASGAPRILRPAFSSNALLKWIYDFGNGSDGAVTKSATGTIAPGLYQHTTFAINNAVVITLAARGPLIIMAQTSINIIGTLSVDGMGARGGIGNGTTADDSSLDGGGGIYGGGGGSNNVSGYGGGTFLNPGVAPTANGAAQSTRTQDTLLNIMSSVIGQITQAGPSERFGYGGGGGAGASGAGTAAGGDGGGLLILIAPVITVAATGILTADGTAGVTSSFTTGNGGGGAIICATPAGGYTNNGSVAANGDTSSGRQFGGNGWVRNFII